MTSQKLILQNNSHLNALESKFDIDVKKVKVILEPPFEQTWLAPHPQCYIPSPKVIDLLVPEKIFKGFLPYMDMVAILVMCPRLIEQIFVSPS